MRTRILAETPRGGGSRARRHKWSAEPWPTTAAYSQQWVSEHRGHAAAGARSAFAAFRDSLWGPWRVWCACGASIVTSRASCELICLVARPSVLRMEIDKWKAKTGDQTAAVS